MHDIKIVDYKNSYIDSIKDIREEVFIKEQKISRDIEFDGKDDEAIHVLVFFQNIALATGRMLSDGRIGRIAVLKEHRKKQIGTMIIKAFINEALKRDFKKVYLDSQKNALAFYEKLGFEISSEVFVKAGIEHITMQKVLKS